MTVDILCKVVDNLGDIGFAYRLARALSELPDAPRLRLVVDDLSAFAAICPGVRTDAGLQAVGDWQLARWADPGDEALAAFRAERPRLVLECYACGRPDWFESILFDERDPEVRHIVNLEYLTAESWASDFHLLSSLTRSPLVRKAFFMPGLAPGTGGLLMDRAFAALVDACADPAGRLAVRRAALARLATPGPGAAPGASPEPGERGGAAGADPAAAFWFLSFSYERDFSGIVADLASFAATRPVLALVAAGRGSAPFLAAWERAGRPFPALALPLLPQSEWDAFLAAADFAVVRGEESFARACLAGNPFLWQCYPFAETPPGLPGATAASAASAGADQSGHTAGGGQLPRVRAFLERIGPCLPPAEYAAYERLTLSFNASAPAAAVRPGELLPVLPLPGPAPDRSALAPAFARFSREVRNLGNLAANLLTFMRDLGYNSPVSP